MVLLGAILDGVFNFGRGVATTFIGGGTGILVSIILLLVVAGVGYLLFAVIIQLFWKSDDK